MNNLVLKVVVKVHKKDCRHLGTDIYAFIN